jgi:hypothetical protein
MMNASDAMMTDENIKGHFGSVLANSLRQKNASIASPHASSQRASREYFGKRDSRLLSETMRREC